MPSVASHDLDQQHSPEARITAEVVEEPSPSAAVEAVVTPQDTSNVPSSILDDSTDDRHVTKKDIEPGESEEENATCDLEDSNSDSSASSERPAAALAASAPTTGVNDSVVADEDHSDDTEPVAKDDDDDDDSEKPHGQVEDHDVATVVISHDHHHNNSADDADAVEVTTTSTTIRLSSSTVSRASPPRRRRASASSLLREKERYAKRGARVSSRLAVQDVAVVPGAVAVEGWLETHHSSHSSAAEFDVRDMFIEEEEEEEIVFYHENDENNPQQRPSQSQPREREHISGDYGVDSDTDDDMGSNYYSSELGTIITASVVNEEDELERLQQAENHGREEVLKNAVVAEALVMKDGQHNTHKNKYLKYGCALGWFALMVAVAAVVGSIVANKSPAVAPAPSPTILASAPTTDHDSTIAPTAPTMAPTQQHYYNNTYCFNAQPIEMDGPALTDNQVLKSAEGLGVFHPCENPAVTYGIAGWYYVRGNGRVATIRLCRCAAVLYVATGACTSTSAFQSNHCFLSAATTKLAPLMDSCFQGSWPTVPGVDYYMAVGTVLDAAVSCRNKAEEEDATTTTTADSSSLSRTTYTLSLNSNDFCKFAFPVVADGTTLYRGSTYNSTREKVNACGVISSDGSTAGGNNNNNRNKNNSTMISNGVWYTVIGTGQAMTFQACSDDNGTNETTTATVPTTKLSIYKGTCTNQQLKCVVALSPITTYTTTTTPSSTTSSMCENPSSVSWLSNAGEEYRILVYAEENPGPFVLTGFQAPPNDFCLGAISLSLETTSTASSSSSASSTVAYNGTTVGATYSNDATYVNQLLSCRLNVSTNSPGVWYELEGLDARTVTVDTCSHAATFHPNVVVIKGDFCEATLTCPEKTVYSNACSATRGSVNRVTWNIRKGETFFLFVYGQAHNETGDFILNITSTLVSSD